MDESTPEHRREALAEAVALFDAGNHAWGRFYQYLYLHYQDSPAAPAAAPVREALREAALSVPQADDAGEILAFASAVATVYEELTVFMNAAPPALRAGDILTAPESFRECLGLLLSLLSDE